MSTDTIGSGKDHTTIADWFAAIPATTIEAEIGLMTGTFTLTADLTMGGKTATSSFNITLKPDTGQSFVDSKDDVGFKLQYDAAQGTAITTSTNYTEIQITQSFFRIHQMQLDATGNNGYADKLLDVNAADVLIQDSIITAEPYHNFDLVLIGGALGGDANPTHIVNCLFITDNPSGSPTHTGVGLDDTAKAINCTHVKIGAGGDAGVGYTDGGALDTVVKSSCSFVNTTGFEAVSWDAESDYNASDDTTGPGANSVDSLTFADQFESTTDDFRLKSGSDLIGVGNTDSDYPNDILGTVRGVGTAGDIGCHEFVEAVSFIAKKGLNINRAVQRASNW